MTNTELDALILRRVMGGEFTITIPNYLVGGGTVDMSRSWHPTEDISQAMQAIEKMHTMDAGVVPHHLTLRYDPYRKYEGALMWTATFGTGGRGDANTPELAICKAIASALGG